jgi:hypothetical protein
VLLRRLFHLDLSELAYLPLKADEAHETSLLLHSLSAHQRELLVQLNDLDAAIYHAASVRLNTVLQSVATSTDFELELTAFRSSQALLARNCSSQVGHRV